MASANNATTREVDVIVIGGGMSGLFAANSLCEKGYSVGVLEASSRFGGRTETVSIDLPQAKVHKETNATAATSSSSSSTTTTTTSVYADLGGMWIGPTHTNMLDLGKKLGIEYFPQFDNGNAFQDEGSIGGGIATYKGTVPVMPLLSLIEVQVSILWRLERMAKLVPVDAPHECPNASLWDALSIEAWKQTTLYTPAAKEMFDVSVRLILGAEPSEVSMLYFLWYVHAAGGLLPLLDIEGGAQEQRVVGGMQQLSNKLAERVAASDNGFCVLSAPVRSIHDDDDGSVTTDNSEPDGRSFASSPSHPVLVQTDAGDFRCKFVVAAIPPHQINRIAFQPPLPLVRRRATERLFVGHYTKLIVFYDSCFWRKQGFSGNGVRSYPDAEVGMVVGVFDYCQPGGVNPALVCFVAGDMAVLLDRFDEATRHERVVNYLVSVFGEDASKPLKVVSKSWAHDPWAGGCPVSMPAPGGFQKTFPILARPVGRVHFAGTETATRWPGYLEGAIDAAKRATEEVTERLRAPHDAEHSNSAAAEAVRAKDARGTLSTAPSGGMLSARQHKKLLLQEAMHGWTWNWQPAKPVLGRTARALLVALAVGVAAWAWQWWWCSQ